MVLSRFAATANHGRLPRAVPARGPNNIPQGRETRARAIPDSFWQNVWNDAHGLPSGLPRVTPRSNDFRQPAQRLFERLGSTTNPSHFILLQNSVNAVKGKLEIFYSPMEVRIFNRHVRLAAGSEGTETDIMTFMAPLRDVRLFLFLKDQ